VSIFLISTKAKQILKLICRFLSPSSIQNFRLYDDDSFKAWRSNFLSTGIEIVEEREFHPEMARAPYEKKLKTPKGKDKTKTEKQKRKGKAKSETSSPSEKSVKKKKTTGPL
jgi:hypothetical protein